MIIIIIIIVVKLLNMRINEWQAIVGSKKRKT